MVAVVAVVVEVVVVVVVVITEKFQTVMKVGSVFLCIICFRTFLDVCSKNN